MARAAGVAAARVYEGTARGIGIWTSWMVFLWGGFCLALIRAAGPRGDFRAGAYVPLSGEGAVGSPAHEAKSAIRLAGDQQARRLVRGRLR